MKFMSNRLLPILLFLIVNNAVAQSLVDVIPNQKLVTGSYVSNPDKILDTTTVVQIDAILASLEQRTSAQVAVVVLNSIGIEDNVELAQALFEKWGIGQKGNDNGLLILFAKEQRIVRFHTGYGLEGVLPDVVCKRIQMTYMVPEFKNENYAAGILAGIQEVDKILSDPKYAEEINQLANTPPEQISDFTGVLIFLSIGFGILWLIIFLIKHFNGHFADSKEPQHTDFPEMRLTHWAWIFQYVLIPVLIVAAFGFSGIESSAAAGLTLISLYLYFMITLIHRQLRMKKVINKFVSSREYSQIVEFLRKQDVYWFFIGLVFPPFLIYFFYLLTRKKAYRNHPRDCQQCQNKMIKLNDLAEDEYLTKNMLLEEDIKSVDYDVWKCQSCSSIEISHYLSRYSKYEPCPKCKTIAYYISSDRTLVSASYSSSGKGETTRECKYCGHKKKSTYTIAKLERTSSSSGSSFGSSSSSSSSGGSWGGGSSGGGGASSSW
jgi:uncharacterized protein